MSVFVKGMKMPMCCADCRFFIYADFGAFVECSALEAFMTKDKVPEGRREDCPLVDEETVKRGKWKQGWCSECGYNWSKDAPIANVPNYYPNCGAKMKGEHE